MEKRVLQSKKMAVAVVANLIPIFYTVAGDQSGYYLGRTFWFGLFVTSGIVVQVCQVPWDSIHREFDCQGNMTRACITECSEAFFNVPVIGVWYDAFFISTGLYFLWEFFWSEIRQKTEGKLAESGESKVELSSALTVQVLSSSETFALKFHGEKRLILLYLFYVFLQIITQCVFLYLLLYQHLPLVSQASIYCSTDYCPGPSRCLIRNVAEKRMPINVLIFLYSSTILISLGFFLYKIYRYFTK